MSVGLVAEKIRGLIAERTGIVVPEHDLVTLRQAVAERAVACGCLTEDDYHLLLSCSGSASAEFTGLVKLLTVGHTRFFRDPAQFVALRDIVLPRIVAQRRAAGDQRPIRALSAGCSTGEEPHSIAMVLLDAHRAAASPPFGVVAVDISPDALAVARSGRYSKETLRYVGAEWTGHMQRHCSLDDRGVTVSDGVARHIEFIEANLLDYDPDGTFDIVFCRNVVIYFSEEAASAMLGRMRDWLSPGGYMFAGAAESPSRMCPGFAATRLGRTFVYTRADGASRPPDARRETASRAPASLPARVGVGGRRPDTLGAPERRGRENSSAPGRSPLHADGFAREAAAWLAEEDLGKAERAARAALDLDPRSPGAFALLAEILAAAGNLDEAETTCRSAIGLDRLAARPHFLMGLIHKGMAQPKAALADMKRCVYLDPKHSLAHFTIAGLYREMGLERAAERAYRNALNTLGGTRRDDAD